MFRCFRAFSFTKFWLFCEEFSPKVTTIFSLQDDEPWHNPIVTTNSSSAEFYGTEKVSESSSVAWKNRNPVKMLVLSEEGMAFHRPAPAHSF